MLQELLLKLVEEYYPLTLDPDAPPEPTPVKGSRSRKSCPVRLLGKAMIRPHVAKPCCLTCCMATAT